MSLKGGKLKAVYVGQRKNGLRCGWGTCQWKRGSRVVSSYEGMWVNDQMHGEGTYKTEGCMYKGPFQHNLFHGQKCVFYFANGAVYSGEFKYNQIHGWGTFSWPSGQCYQGNYEDGVRKGHGTCLYSNGNIYVGQWSQDRRHGRGILKCSNGAVYEGKWTYNKLENIKGVWKFNTTS